MDTAIQILNYYIDTSTFAFRDNHIELEQYKILLNNSEKYPGYAITDEKEQVIGICKLKPYSEMATFNETAEMIYFIKDQFTGMGLGLEILKRLETDAYDKGIRRLLVSISSENHASIKFHEKHGFSKCGEFHKIGKKFGRYFDVIWMEKELIAH